MHNTNKADPTSLSFKSLFKLTEPYGTPSNEKVSWSKKGFNNIISLSKLFIG